VNPSLEAGHRGKNPLGHTGSSENYFVVNEVGGTLFAKDYKRPGNPTYNGLTYLLVDIDERPVEGPQGPLSPRETWLAWAEARKRGLLDCGDAIPTKALEHIAREQELYNFAALDADLRDDDVELPAKAHNRALWWVNNRWADEAEVDVDDDENATSKSGRTKTGPAPRTWEDVRYIYDESKEDGRRAARTLLSTRYDLMTVEETDSLRVYDPETGIYTEETGELRAEIYDGLKSHWSTHELNEVLAGLRQHNIVPKHELNATALDGPYICVENGALDLLDRELKDHSPEHYFVDRVPVTYDPDADTTPHEEFVGELVEREEDKRALLEMVGHALTPDANERWKKFLILTGDADNGKSAFYGRVKALLDGPDSEERNTSAVKLAKMAQNRFSVYSMYGSMANIAGEIDGKKIRNTAAIKDIPGGDPVELEPKGGDSFFDTVNTTLMFAANDPPIIGERDKEAIATRIVPVELPYTFTDDPDGPNEKQAADEGDLEERLDTDEARSGLLNLALDGIERLEANGGDVSLPEPPEERLRMYERTADPMREFGERCLANEAGDYVVKADVTTVYKEFATAEGYELGSNVGSVLHDVLRGVPGLNYAESRKRSPDYAQTGLPLRAWDERKRVIDRVTLTEEGLEYAESAGVIDDDGDDAESADGRAELEALEAGWHDLEVTVAEQLEPPEWLQGKGHVVDSDGNIAPYESEGTDPLATVDEGDTVNLRTAKVEDRNGVATLVLSGISEVVRAEQQSVTAADPRAATDGGEGTEDAAQDAVEQGEDDTADQYAQPKPKVREAVVAAVEARGNKPAPTEAVVGELDDMDKATAETTLEALKTEGTIQRMKGGWIPN
jgi:putative DNA primase/helicase